MKKTDIPISYGGIVIPWRGMQTCEMMLTTVRGPNGSVRYALPKGGPNNGESCKAAARREVREETDIQTRLHILLSRPIAEYCRHSNDGELKHIVLFLMATDAHGPYLPKHSKKHPFAEAIPIRQVSAYLDHPEDAMHLAGIQSILEEMVARMKGSVRWDGYFAKHPKQALELERNMQKFLRRLQA